MWALSTNGKANLAVTLKNNKLFNSAGHDWDNWVGMFSEWEAPNTNFKAYNNTYFETGRGHAIAGAAHGSDSIYHNTYCNTWGDTFFPNYNDDVVFKNNIFYNAQIRGYVGKRAIMTPADTLFHYEGDYSDWAGPGLTDTLCGSVSIMPIAIDSTQSRHVQVTNNILFLDQTVRDFYAANNVTPQPFLNKDVRRLAGRYGWNIANNYVWEEGDALNPVFAMGEQPAGVFTNMFKNRQQRHLPASMQSADFPYENAWHPGGESDADFIWPLPFNLKPNAALNTKSDDGYPLGDLNWYGKDVVADFEAGKPYSPPATNEVVVDPGLNTLSEAITAHPGSTLLLASGGDYVIDATLQIIAPTIIRGEVGAPEDRPAVIYFTADPGQAQKFSLINVSSDLTLKNLGIMGYCNDGQQIRKTLNMSADGVKLTIDGCVFQGNMWALSTNGKGNLDITLKNNKLFNSAGHDWDNWVGMFSEWEAPHTKFKAYNNTYFETGRGHAIAGAAHGSDSIYHNTYCNTWGDTFFPNYNDNVVFKNNIFYNAQIRGYVGKRSIKQPDNTIFQYDGDYSDWAGPGLNDTLCGSVSIMPIDIDSTQSRNVQVTNNALFMDQTVLNFWAANNVTGQPFLNKDVRRLAGRYGWNIANNYVPEQGNALNPVFKMGEQPAGVFTNMFLNRQQRHLPASMQSADFPYENAWHPGGESDADFIWPLPFDLTPTVSLNAKSDDGYPLGDLNWYGADVVAGFEAGTPYTSLKENKAADFGLKIYGDKIHYNLDKNANVTLSLYDTKGALVATLFNGYQAGGEQVLAMPNLKNNIYVCKLRVGNSVQVSKVAVVK
jgi:hypothetical protein